MVSTSPLPPSELRWGGARRALGSIRVGRRHLPVLYVALALIPVVAVLVTRVGRPYLPMGDPASIDLRVRDVFTVHSPLVGPYSRGFNHPGPMVFWLLAPLSALTGGAPWATIVGGALLHGVAIGGVAWLAFRRGGPPFMLTMLAALALAYAGIEFGVQFLEVWNPYLAVPFFMLFLLATWAFAEGDRWQLVTLVVVGSFVVQAHYGYALLVAAAAVWAVVVVWFDRHRAHDDPPPPRWRRVLLWSEIAAVVLWLPAVVQQVTSDDGNLAAIWNFVTRSGSRTGLADGAGLLAREFTILPPWFDGHEGGGLWQAGVVPASTLWLLLPAALLALGFAAAHRTGRRGDRRLLELAAVVAVASVVALAQVSVEPEAYLFLWRITVAVFLVTASLWAVANWFPWRDDAGLRAVVTTGLVAIVAVAFGQRALDVIRHRDQVSPFEAVARDMVAQAEASAAPGSRMLVRSVGPTTFGFDQGIIDALDRDGIPVRVDRRYGYHFGDARTASREDASEIWYVAEQGRFGSVFSNLQDARIVAYSTPLTPQEEEDAVRIQRSVTDALVAAGRRDLFDALDTTLVDIVVGAAQVPGIDQADLQRLAQLNGKTGITPGGCRCTVIGFDAENAPELPYTLG